jgi:transposase
VRNARLWSRLLGVEHTVIQRVELDEDTGAVVASVRPARGHRRRCGICQRRCSGYDTGEGRRRWRALDLGTVQVYLEADAPRVSCPEHGVVVAYVPWARHGAGHTHRFDDTVAWLATVCSKTAVLELMRIAWRTVGAIVARVWNDVEASTDRFAGLRRLGIDEISYKKGHKYITVVVDHDTGKLVWAAAGRDKKTLRRFFTVLGPERCQAITHVSADGAGWIADVVDACCPNAVRTADPFHVVSWGTEALDEVRREAWNAARGGRGGRTAASKALKNARWALWKNPDNLTDAQQAKLEWIAKTYPMLHRAWALKEGLRTVFAIGKTSPDAAVEALDRWISWARRCRIPAFVTLQRRIVKHHQAIVAAIEHGLSNGRTESLNTKIRLITRMAFGFHNADALIALAMLSLGGHRPILPGR